MTFRHALKDNVFPPSVFVTTGFFGSCWKSATSIGLVGGLSGLQVEEEEERTSQAA